MPHCRIPPQGGTRIDEVVPLWVRLWWGSWPRHGQSQLYRGIGQRQSRAVMALRRRTNFSIWARHARRVRRCLRKTWSEKFSVGHRDLGATVQVCPQWVKTVRYKAQHSCCGCVLVLHFGVASVILLAKRCHAQDRSRRSSSARGRSLDRRLWWKRCTHCPRNRCRSFVAMAISPNRQGDTRHPRQIAQRDGAFEEKSCNTRCGFCGKLRAWAPGMGGLGGERPRVAPGEANVRGSIGAAGRI